MRFLSNMATRFLSPVGFSRNRLVSRGFSAVLLSLLLFTTGAQAAPQQTQAQKVYPASQVYLDLTTLPWYSQLGFPEKMVDQINQIQSLKPAGKFPLTVEKMYPDLAARFDPDLALEVGFYTLFDLPARRFDKNLALKFPGIGENWEVWFNGKKLISEVFTKEVKTDSGETGFVIEKKRAIKNVIIPLPESLLRLKNNTVAVRILGNVSPIEAIPNLKFGISYNKGVEVAGIDRFADSLAETFSLFLYSAMVFFGVYHLALFLLRLKDVFNLWFSLFAISMGLYLFSFSNFYYSVFSNSDSSTLIRFEYISLFFILPFLILFLQKYLYRDKQVSLTAKIIVGIYLTLALCVLVVSFDYARLFLTIGQYALLASLGYLVYIVVFAIRRGGMDATYIAASISFGVLAGVFDLVASMTLFTDVRFFIYSILAIIIGFTILIARGITRNEQRTMELNEVLTDTNQAFFRFVPTQVMSELGKQSATQLNVGDHVLRLMSVLFSDIRSFTTLAEQMNPEETFKFLNYYLARMEPKITSHHGFIDKYIGDAILALFPELPPEYNAAEGEMTSTADRSINSALAMLEQIQEYNKYRYEKDLIPVKIGIGIDTGPLLLGTVGSQKRLDTTVVGDTVNTASRLEGMTSLFGESLLVTDFTLREYTRPEKLFHRKVGAILPKGKKQAVTIHEIFNADPVELREKKLSTREILLGAIEYYQVADFKTALDKFEEALRLFPGDYLATNYHKLCRKMVRLDKPKNWKGLIRMSSK